MAVGVAVAVAVAAEVCQTGVFCHMSSIRWPLMMMRRKNPSCLSDFCEAHNTHYAHGRGGLYLVISYFPGSFGRRASNDGSRRCLTGTGSTQNGNTPRTAATARSVAGSLGAFQHGSYYFTTTNLVVSKKQPEKTTKKNVRTASQRTLQNNNTLQRTTQTTAQITVQRALHDSFNQRYKKTSLQS